MHFLEGNRKDNPIGEDNPEDNREDYTLYIFYTCYLCVFTYVTYVLIFEREISRSSRRKNLEEHTRSTAGTLFT